MNRNEAQGAVRAILSIVPQNLAVSTGAKGRDTMMADLARLRSAFPRIFWWSLWH